MSTAGTITHRTPLTGSNNPAYQASKNWANDSLVVASAAADGSVLVRDSTQPDGWGFNPAAAAAGTLTGATLAANVLASSLTSLGTLSALAVSGAAPLFTRDALAVTSTDGLVLQNTTAATAGVPVQLSPRLRFRSQVWNTTAVAATNTQDWLIENLPESAATPGGYLRFGVSKNGGAITYPLILDSGGGTTMLGSGTAVSFTASATFNGPVFRSGGAAANSQLTMDGAGLFKFLHGVGPTGVGVDVATDAVLKIRTRAQTAYASLMSSNHYVDDGNATFPSYSFTSEAGLGFWRSAAGTITMQGNFIATGSVRASTNFVVGGANGIVFSPSLAILYAPASAQFNFTNNAVTAGVGFDVATDAVLKIRTRAQTGYATVDALGYSVSGAAGASKAAGPVTSITVVNGIVTACT